MSSNNWLTLFIVSVIGIAGYIALTKPKLDERDPYGSLEEDWWG